MAADKRRVQVHALTLVSVALRLEWLQWQKRSLSRAERVSHREARFAEGSTNDPQDDEAARWQAALELELATLAAQQQLPTPPAVIVSRKVPNAGSDGSNIYLNPSWAQEITAQICRTDGACKQALLRGIAAHEFAHHLREELVIDRHSEELRADAWAARVLSEAGASVEPYMRLISSGAEQATATHPAAADRRAAVRAAVVAPLPSCSPAGGDDCLGPRTCEACECATIDSQPSGDCVCDQQDQSPAGDS